MTRAIFVLVTAAALACGPLPTVVERVADVAQPAVEAACADARDAVLAWRARCGTTFAELLEVEADVELVCVADGVDDLRFIAECAAEWRQAPCEMVPGRAAEGLLFCARPPAGLVTARGRE